MALKPLRRVRLADRPELYSAVFKLLYIHISISSLFVDFESCSYHSSMKQKKVWHFSISGQHPQTIVLRPDIKMFNFIFCPHFFFSRCVRLRNIQGYGISHDSRQKFNLPSSRMILLNLEIFLTVRSVAPETRNFFRNNHARIKIWATRDSGLKIESRMKLQWRITQITPSTLWPVCSPLGCSVFFWFLQSRKSCFNHFASYGSRVSHEFDRYSRINS